MERNETARSGTEGHLEIASRSTIIGWAFDHDDPISRVQVTIFANESLLWSSEASEFRQDLLDAGLGDGCHSFCIRNMPLPLGSDIKLRAVLARTGRDLTNSPALICDGAARNFPTSATPILEPPVQAFVLRGTLDSLDSAHLRGWAQNVENPESPTFLALYIDTQFHTVFAANEFREDLRNAFNTSGLHAFCIPTPVRLLDGQPHQIAICAVNTFSHIAVPQNPITISSPLPIRYFSELQALLVTARKRLDDLTLVLQPSYNDTVIRTTHQDILYQHWRDRFGKLTPINRTEMLQTVISRDIQTKFSVLMPTFNTDPDMLRAAIESVISQVYPYWELCISDDGSTSPTTIAVIRHFVSADARIKAIYRDQNGHISEATNSALSLASGNYICFFDHDDLLSPDALFHLAASITSYPFRLLYTDEDKIDQNGVHQDPHFKSAFNYSLLLSYNYICHLLCVERALVDEVGGFRSETNGSQDHDYILRCVERLSSKEIAHIPLVLYHWRIHGQSTSATMGAKSYAVTAGVRAIQDHLDRLGTKAKCEALTFGYRVTWPIPAICPKVSVIIPTRDSADVLAICLSGLLNNTNYPNLEIILVDNGSIERTTRQLFKTASQDYRIRIIRSDDPFNYSRLCNFGRAKASGELLLMLNNDIEVIEPAWLTEMVSQILRPGVGAVGAKLLYPDRRVQHAGVILGIGGVAGHAHKFLGNRDPGYCARAILTQELSACTAACLLLRADAFDAVNGFDEEDLSIAFNDVDLCLKLRATGLKVVFTPFAELIHHESISRGLEDLPYKILRSQSEAAYMRRAWAEAIESDPFYSPNLTLEHEDFRIDPTRGSDHTTWPIKRSVTTNCPVSLDKQAENSSQQATDENP